MHLLVHCVAFIIHTFANCPKYHMLRCVSYNYASKGWWDTGASALFTRAQESANLSPTGRSRKFPRNPTPLSLIMMAHMELFKVQKSQNENNFLLTFPSVSKAVFHSLQKVLVYYIGMQIRSELSLNSANSLRIRSDCEFAANSP